MDTFYKFLRQSWPFIGPVLGFVTLANGFLGYTPAQMYTAGTGAATYVANVRVLWLIASVLCFFFTYVNLKHKGVPLTVLSTNIELTLMSANGDHAILTRTQKIRANQENVTGYRRKVRSSSGTIPKHLIECDVSHCGPEKQKKQFWGNEHDLELVHRFEAIPRTLWKFGLDRVTRTETIHAHGAFCNDEEFFEFEVPPPYQHKKITATVFFHPARPCHGADCSAVWISANGVVNMDIRHVPPRAGTGSGIKISVKHPREGDRFNISWKYAQPASSAAIIS